MSEGVRGESLNIRSAAYIEIDGAASLSNLRSWSFNQKIRRHRARFSLGELSMVRLCARAKSHRPFFVGDTA
jgi:hypothetical protein